MTTICYNNWDKIKSKNILSLKLLGSHDSASYSVSENNFLFSDNKTLESVNKLPFLIKKFLQINKLIYSFAKSQSLTINNQLCCGVRSLDLRIVEYKNVLYTNHSLLGMTLQDVLNEVNAFMSTNSYEFIELRFIWSDTRFPYDLSDKITNIILNHDIKNKTIKPENVTKSLQELKDTNCRCLCIMEGNNRNNSLSNTIFSNRYVDSNISNTKILSIQNQLTEFNSTDKIYNLEYILTPSKDDIKNAVYKFNLSKNNLLLLNNKLPKPTFVYLNNTFNLNKIHVCSIDFVNCENIELANSLIQM